METAATKGKSNYSYMYYYVADLSSKSTQSSSPSTAAGTSAEGFILNTSAICGTVNMSLVYAGEDPLPFYVGTWKVTSVAVAPWIDQRPKPDAPQKQLLNQSFSIVRLDTAEYQIFGPLTCTDGSSMKISISKSTVQQLFQGALNRDPLKLARNLGFKFGQSWRTLETGCGPPWYFSDPTTAKISINNYVYTLTKQ
jgi:hypothetical protein